MDGHDNLSSAKKICLEDDIDWFESEEEDFRSEECGEDDESEKEDRQSESDDESESETTDVEQGSNFGFQRGADLKPKELHFDESLAESLPCTSNQPDSPTPCASSLLAGSSSNVDLSNISTVNSVDEDIQEYINIIRQALPDPPKRSTFIESSKAKWDSVRDELHAAFAMGISVRHISKMKCAKLVLGEAASRKLAGLTHSNDTIRPRIDELSLNIQSQLLKKVKASIMFAIQLDKTTDITYLSQLMVISEFFEQEELDWGKLVGVCTDGAPEMLGCRSGFVELVKKKNPLTEGTHCFVRREVLAARTLPQSMNDHLTTAIKAVNYIERSALNTRLFNKICKDVNASHLSVLVHTKVKWLSKGNMLARIFELRSEILESVNTQKKNNLPSSLTADQFEPTLAYLVDIFASLNELNQKLQGRDKNVLTTDDSISAFKDILELWLSESISGHLVALGDEFSKYFSKIDANKEILRNLARNPIKRCVEEVLDELQEELLESYNCSSVKNEFGAKSVEEI
ncbi:zinc finger BED domain-containing protein 5-like [Watersipora subatra]|uniref:zinc finger BED domain-containing protein 5-like n=1 Tax=Watersipora subatra TaxID=2589382 RepID=UPI00355C3B6D